MCSPSLHVYMGDSWGCDWQRYIKDFEPIDRIDCKHFARELALYPLLKLCTYKRVHKPSKNARKSLKYIEVLKKNLLKKKVPTHKHNKIFLYDSIHLFLDLDSYLPIKCTILTTVLFLWVCIWKSSHFVIFIKSLLWCETSWEIKCLL